jgi:hypothetical protein
VAVEAVGLAGAGAGLGAGAAAFEVVPLVDDLLLDEMELERLDELTLEWLLLA